MQSLEKVASRVARLLVDGGATVAVAESSAGGLISAALLAVPGASAYFRGGDVIYTAQARAAFGITDQAMEGLRSSSPPYARLLAQTACLRLGTDWAIAETGAAGPSGNRYGDPAGHSCIAIEGQVNRERTLVTGSTDRSANMRAFAVEALLIFEGTLLQQLQIDHHASDASRE